MGSEMAAAAVLVFLQHQQSSATARLHAIVGRFGFSPGSLVLLSRILERKHRLRFARTNTLPQTVITNFLASKPSKAKKTNKRVARVEDFLVAFTFTVLRLARFTQHKATDRCCEHFLRRSTGVYAVALVANFRLEDLCYRYTRPELD